MKTAKIYELRDPRDGAVRYVGRCTCSLTSRRCSHEHEAHVGYRNANGGGLVNARKQEWLRELANLGLRPEIVLVKEVSSTRRFAERAWIRKRLRDGADLLNILGVRRRLS